MSAPPLIRPLRSLLQGRVPLATARSARPLLRPSIQLRANSSITPDPNAPKPGAAKPSTTSSTPDAAPVVSETEVAPEPKVETPKVEAETPAATPESVAAEPVVAQTEAVKPTPSEPKAAEIETTEATGGDALVAEAASKAAAKSAAQKVEDAKFLAVERNFMKNQEPETDDIPIFAQKDAPRMPRSLEALYLKPLRKTAEYGVPACNLHLRSYSVRNLEFFCDFALRAAYYLGLPASGPVPLPRLTERWTVPKSHFIFKKSQENFERITLRRLIQIKDGHPETVQVWLAFLQKYAYYGIGMKANVWEFSKIGVGKTMDETQQDVQRLMKDKWKLMAERSPLKENVDSIADFYARQRVKASGGR